MNPWEWDEKGHFWFNRDTGEYLTAALADALREGWHEGRPEGSGWYIVTVEPNESSLGRRFTWPAYFVATVPDESASHWADLPGEWEVVAWRKLPPALAAQGGDDART